MMPVMPRGSKIESTPPPVMGLNTTDPVTNLDPRYARKFLNFFPGEYSVKVREGYEEWVTGLPNSIETLIPYVKSNGTKFLYAATSSGLFDVTTTGTLVGLGLETLVPTLTNGRISYVQFTNLSGTYLFICNDSADPSYIYDGTDWTACSAATPADDVGEFNGVDPDDFAAVTSHMRRLWFIERNSLTAWYLPTDAISGDASPFYLGSIFKKGGKLKNIFTWSSDSGEGMDDLLIFQSSEGELAAYAGTDPTDANLWQLAFTRHVAPPMTDRPSVELGGDVLLLTSYGVMSVKDIIQTSGKQLSYSTTLSSKIFKSLSAELKSRGENAHWEIHVHPTRQMLFVNFPAATRQPVQFVMNLTSGAWAQWDMPVHTARLLGDALYFSDNAGTVYKWGDIYRDNLSLDGTTWDYISASFEQAYTDLGNRGQNKHFNLIRLLWVSHQHPTYVVGLSLDFYDNSAFYTWAYPLWAEEGYLWSEDDWDESLWTGAPSARYRWDGIEGLGYTASLMLRIKTKRFVELANVDWAFAVGASL